MRLSLRRGSDAISPTAHYTGHVWGRNGLSHDELSTVEGRVLFGALMPTMTASRLLGGPTLEGLLLSRHRIIDQLLTAAIEDGRVDQVLEIGCGMAPRGWRYAERYGNRVTYVEADLPAMASRKRRALERIGSLGERHRVEEVDALSDESLARVTAGLDRHGGLAIITEGVLTYFGEADVLGMWRRFARELAPFAAGLYLADIRLGGSTMALPERVFRRGLSAFVRGAVHTHFGGETGAIRALREAGFAETRLHRADRHAAAGDAASDPAASRIHIVEATT